MADLKTADSAYASSGAADTHTDLVNNVDDADADHINHPVSAILAIQAVLGDGLTLPGTQSDLASRLAVPIETNGKLKDFSSTTKTTHPGVVSEGMTGATSFSASQIIRKHSSNDVLESTGYTVPGTSGVMVSEDDTQTLTNKTLTSPSITGPTITGTSVGREAMKTSTVSAAGSLVGAMSAFFTLNAYAFFPMIHSESTNVRVCGHTTDGASADNPRFGIVNTTGNTYTYDMDYRYLQAN